MKKKLLAMSVLAAISSQANAFQFDTSGDWQFAGIIPSRPMSWPGWQKQDNDVYDQADAAWIWRMTRTCRWTAVGSAWSAPGWT